MSHESVPQGVDAVEKKMWNELQTQTRVFPPDFDVVTETEQVVAQADDGSNMRIRFERAAAMPKMTAKQKKSRDHATRVFVPRVSAEEMVPFVSPGNQEDAERVRDAISVLQVESRTLVVVAVVDTEVPENNQPTAVRCFGAVALGGYPYDNNLDAYMVPCCAFADLGAFGFGYRITITGVGEWRREIPIPPAVLERHFGMPHRERIEAIRKQYPSPRFAMHYVQMLGLND